MHLIAKLVAGAALLAAGGIGTFYSGLAVGVSDEYGLLTAQFMLAACAVAALAGLLLIGRSAKALWDHL